MGRFSRFRLRLDYFFSTSIGIADDSGVDIEDWVPESADLVHYGLDMGIGNNIDSGTHHFQVVIATPEGLLKTANDFSEQFKEDPVISDRHLILLKTYSWENVINHIEYILEKCSMNTWDESCLKLQRYFLWEYEDFIYDADRLN